MGAVDWTCSRRVFAVDSSWRTALTSGTGRFLTGFRSFRRASTSSAFPYKGIVSTGASCSQSKHFPLDVSSRRACSANTHPHPFTTTNLHFPFISLPVSGQAKYGLFGTFESASLTSKTCLRERMWSTSGIIGASLFKSRFTIASLLYSRPRPQATTGLSKGALLK